jgi:hypothetical protein
VDPVRVLIFIAAFVLFVPVRWRVWGGRLRDNRWFFLNKTFGEIVDAERRRSLVVVPIEAAVLALLTYLST